MIHPTLGKTKPPLENRGSARGGERLASNDTGRLGRLVLWDVKAPDLYAGLLLRLQVTPEVAEACLERRH